MKLFSLLLFPLVTAATTPPTPPTPPAHTALSSDDDSPTAGSSWQFQNGKSQVEIQTTGNVVLDADASEPFQLRSDDASLRVVERESGHVRLLVARPNELTYRVDGVIKAYLPEGKAWLKKVLKAAPPTPTPPPPPAR